MGKTDRNVLRQEAKKAYKEQVKNVPRKQRISFSDFFKRYRHEKLNKQIEEPPAQDQEDFDIEDLVSVNEISDDDLETIEVEEE